LKLRIQGTMLRAPKNIVSWPGYRIHVDAPKQIQNGKARQFQKWSHGRKRQHIIRTYSAQSPVRPSVRFSATLSATSNGFMELRRFHQSKNAR